MKTHWYDFCFIGLIQMLQIIRPSNDAMILNIFESRDYEGKKSAPEWGINLNYGIINFLIAHYEAK